jgi:nicotinamide-nucleotide amidase
MNIAVISSGTELLRGSTVNTNLASLGSMLTSHGIAPALEITVGDDAGKLYAALSMALRHAECVVIIGGLGPTSDDITLECCARFFGLPLERNEELAAKVEAFWHRLHKGHCPKMQYKQAMVPRGAKVIDNPLGSASGIEINCDYDRAPRYVFLAPGPPSEFVPMMRDYVVPRIVEVSENKKTVSGFLAAGIGESTLSAIVRQLLKESQLEISYTSNPEGTRFYLAGEDADAVNKEIGIVHQALGADALNIGEFSLAPHLVAEFKRRKLTLATAESCTGGMASAAITAVPGASEIFRGAITAYDNSVKISQLNVPEQVIADFGAVSSECAAAMAEGAAKLFGTDAAISITGIAGPGGGTENKEVGLVYTGAYFKGRCAVLQHHLRGERDAVRERAVAKSFLLLRQMISEESSKEKAE